MFDIANIWATRTGNDVRLVSANDHIHAQRSAHYAGLALDLLSSNPDALAQLFRQVGYHVLWRVPGHFGHVHVQEDQARPAGSPPARGRSGSEPLPTNDN